MNNKSDVIVIYAPTASGKTALTRELFSKSGSHFILNAEIVSADSQAVYKYMDIGTAKPDSFLCKEIPHHLIDILTPDVQFNVSDFVSLADIECEKIINNNRIPVVCGGTGFYIKNFLYGVPPTPVSNEKIRNELQKRIQIEGNNALHEELYKIDPLSAKKIHVNDSYRICRALEVYYSSGKTRSSFNVESHFRDKFNFIFIVLEPPRDFLYKKIRERVEMMFSAGLENEIQNLIKMGYTKDSPGLKAIGYSEWFESSDKELIKEQIIHHSCKYAKKQFTYIRDIKESNLISYSGIQDIDKVIEVIKHKINLSL